MSKQCPVCKTINHSAANHCSKCGKELPDKELSEEDKLRIELHEANSTIRGLNKAFADMQKFKDLYEEAQKTTAFYKIELNKEKQKNITLIESTKLAKHEIMIHEPPKKKWEKWVLSSLVIILIMIGSINIVFYHPWDQGLDEVENYEVRLPDDSTYLYSGEIKKYSLPNGQGKAIYNDKSVYIGSFSEGLRHGKGKMVFSDQFQYDGDYIHGSADGHGKMIFPDGSYYIGEWRNNMKNGFGTYYDSLGSEVYQGKWENGKPIDNRRKR